MTILDHLILEVSVAATTSAFLSDIIGLDRIGWRPPFLVMRAGVTSLDLLETDGAIAPRHLAFRVDAAQFAHALARLSERGVPYWADPFHRLPHRVYETERDRGIYFLDPDGHRLEMLVEIGPLP